MRFKTGDKVEVMNNAEVPVSWRTAEILCASGHNYSIQYDYNPGMEREPMVEMVPRSFVRPRPLFQGAESFSTGDIVEVFHQYSWKIAVVLNILRGRKEINKTRLKAATSRNQYLVRLLGCSQELVVDRSMIRMRQTWNDNEWILMGKSCRAGDDVITSKPSTSDCRKKIKIQVLQFNAKAKNRHKKDHANIQDDAALEESPVISSRSLKRISPNGSSIIEAHNGHVQKLRATEKEGRRQQVVADPVFEKDYRWRHASFASIGLKMMPGFVAFLLALNFGRFSHLLPKRCYTVYGRSLVSHNLCYSIFLFLQDLLDMLTCCILEESICNVERTWLYEICVPISAKHAFLDSCSMDLNHVKPKLYMRSRSKFIKFIDFHHTPVDIHDSFVRTMSATIP